MLIYRLPYLVGKMVHMYFCYWLVSCALRRPASSDFASQVDLKFLTFDTLELRAWKTEALVHAKTAACVSVPN